MTITQFNRIVEIRTKVISMGTFLAGSLYALTVTDTFSLPRFIVMLFAVLCVDMGTTGFNSYFDYMSGTDTASLNYERDKVLVHEGVSPHLALLISVSLFFIAALLGLLLAYWTSYTLIIVGALSMGVGYLYTGGPFPISRTPLGELFAGGFLGTILFMISFYVQSLQVTLEAAIVSLPFLMLIAMILTINNSCDKEADIKAGRKTLTICLPPSMNTLLLGGEFYGAYLLTIIMSFTSLIPTPLAFTTALALIPSHLNYKKMREDGFSLKTKGSSMKRVSSLFLLYIASFCLGLLLHLIVKI